MKNIIIGFLLLTGCVSNRHNFDSKLFLIHDFCGNDDLMVKFFFLNKREVLSKYIGAGDGEVSCYRFGRYNVIGNNKIVIELFQNSYKKYEDGEHKREELFESDAETIVLIYQTKDSKLTITPICENQYTETEVIESTENDINTFIERDLNIAKRKLKN